MGRGSRLRPGPQPWLSWPLGERASRRRPLPCPPAPSHSAFQIKKPNLQYRLIHSSPCATASEPVGGHQSPRSATPSLPRDAHCRGGRVSGSRARTVSVQPEAAHGARAQAAPRSHPGPLTQAAAWQTLAVRRARARSPGRRGPAWERSTVHHRLQAPWPAGGPHVSCPSRARTLAQRRSPETGWRVTRRRGPAQRRQARAGPCPGSPAPSHRGTPAARPRVPSAGTDGAIPVPSSGRGGPHRPRGARKRPTNTRPRVGDQPRGHPRPGARRPA